MDTRNDACLRELRTREFSRRGFLKAAGIAGAAGFLLTLPGALTGCKSEAGEAVFHHERVVTDQAGREVTIPTADVLERVYFTSPLAQIFIYTLVPDVIVGTGIRFTPIELEYLPEGYDQLPYMGAVSGSAELDKEQLLEEDVQLIFSISGVELTAANISDAQSLQDQTGIPVLCVDGSFDVIADAYRFLGDIFGKEARAEELATYLEKIYADVTAAVGDLKQEEKVKLYYAEGPVGLQTEPDESQHALTFRIGGANNVAAIEETQGLGMSNVSLEQVLTWDPEVIVAWSSEVRGGADQIIRTRSSWAEIKAVKDGRVYTMPNVPYAWCDRPPGVNRFIGIEWVANMLYPDRYPVDMVEETQNFYSTCYWVDISTDQALYILGNSYPPYGKTAKYTDQGTYTPGGGTASADIISSRLQGAD